MAWYEGFKIALQAILANRLRSILTLLGVIIGVTSVITIISALEGLMNSFEDSVSSLGPTTFVVTRFGIITSEEAWRAALKRKNLTLNDMRAIEDACRDCEEVAAEANNRARISRGNRGLRRVQVSGTSHNLLDIVDVELREGRFFTRQEYNRNSMVAFIGPDIAEELFPFTDPIGKTIRIRGRKFKVIGIARERGAVLGNNQDNFAMIPLTAYRKLFGDPSRSFDFSILVKAPTIEMLDETQDQVRAILRARRGVAYHEDDDFAILTAENILAFVEQITLAARIALISISSIALVVGGIVIMNIMMVSVSERTREIGIRKSIGARKKNIMIQFLFESLILSLGGGIIGTVLGIALAIILGSKISLNVEPSIFAIIAGMTISTGVGVFFGLYPAMKAANLHPIEALRKE